MYFVCIWLEMTYCDCKEHSISSPEYTVYAEYDALTSNKAKDIIWMSLNSINTLILLKIVTFNVIKFMFIVRLHDREYTLFILFLK